MTMNPPGGIPNPQGGTPPEATRFSARNQPENPGRTSTAWLRTKLSKAMKDRDISAREAIADHLIEIATSYEVVIKGRGEDAIPLASAKDSIEAAKVLYAYDMGKPVETKEIGGPGGGPIRVSPLTTAEQRALLDKLLAEPDDGKGDDGPQGEAEG